LELLCSISTTQDHFNHNEEHSLPVKTMKHFFSTLLAGTAILASARADAVPWERLDKNNSVLLILDLQDGLFGLARDFDSTLYKNAMIALSGVG
jgi:hypothetical protein